MFADLTIGDAVIHEVPHRAAGRNGAEVRRLPILWARARCSSTDIRALAVMSDLQGVAIDDSRLLGRVMAEELAHLAAIGRMPTVAETSVILAGDLFSSPSGDRRGATGDVQDVYRALVDVGFRFVTGVPGNHDTFHAHADLRALEILTRSGIHVLHGTELTFAGIRIAGFGGIIGSNRRPWRTPPDRYFAELGRLLDARPDILVLHEGPSGPEGPGNDGIRDFLAARADGALVIFGHDHWSHPGATTANGRPLLNVEGRCVIIEIAP